MKENLIEVQAFLTACRTFYLATVEGDQPRVRPFGVAEIINHRLYIMTGKVKDVYKQITANYKFELCGVKLSGTEWIRVSGRLVNDESVEVKKEMLERNPSLKELYSATDDNMAVLYIADGEARFFSFTDPERRIKF